MGDMFDGEGFVRGIRRKGVQLDGAAALVVGCGGVGSAIAASLAAAGVGAARALTIPTRGGCAGPRRASARGTSAARGADRIERPGRFRRCVVNATPLGMNAGDPLPVDVTRVAPTTFVGEVVMKQEMTAFLHAAQARGCRVQVGTDMLFEQIPAYLEFFGFATTTPEALRAVAAVSY